MSPDPSCSMGWHGDDRIEIGSNMLPSMRGIFEMYRLTGQDATYIEMGACLLEEESEILLRTMWEWPQPSHLSWSSGVKIPKHAYAGHHPYAPKKTCKICGRRKRLHP